jgi:hypothetical protein
MQTLKVGDRVTLIDHEQLSTYAGFVGKEGVVLEVYSLHAGVNFGQEVLIPLKSSLSFSKNHYIKQYFNHINR